MAVIRRMLRLMPFGATVAALIWALSTHPLAAPWAERTGQDLVLAIEREVRRVASPAWIETSLADAVVAEDAERAAMLLALADELGHPIQAPAAESLIAAQDSWVAGAQACAACMADVAQCPSVALLGACAVPFELSPLGDLNALRRAGTAWWQDEDVDELDAGLALLGLGATGASVTTGGTSLSLKAGTGLLRMARQMDAVSPGMARMLDLPVDWSNLPGLVAGSARLEDVTDPARLAALGAVADDLGRVRAATSTGETLRLLRAVDTPKDARHLARIAEAMGPQTLRTVDILGKGRAIRASLRLTRTAAATLALIWLTALQAAMIAASALGSRILREVAADRPAPPRREPTFSRV